MMIMMNKASLLLLLGSMVAQWTSVEGSISMGFKADAIDTDSLSPGSKCKPRKLKKIYKIYDAALIKGGYKDLPEDGKWKFRKSVERELDFLDDECSIDPNHPNFLLDHLSNGFMSILITCIDDEDEETDARRNLLEVDEDENEEEDVPRAQGERELQYGGDYDTCLWMPQFCDNFGTSYRRRRNLLRSSEEEPGRVRQLAEDDDVGEVDIQAVVDRIYKLCLKKNLDRCIDCSKAVVCDGDATEDSLTNDDGLCAIPSCHFDEEEFPDGCWDTGLRA